MHHICTVYAISTGLHQICIENQWIRLRVTCKFRKIQLSTHTSIHINFAHLHHEKKQKQKKRSISFAFVMNTNIVYQLMHYFDAMTPPYTILEHLNVIAAYQSVVNKPVRWVRSWQQQKQVPNQNRTEAISYALVLLTWKRANFIPKKTLQRKTTWSDLMGSILNWSNEMPHTLKQKSTVFDTLIPIYTCLRQKSTLRWNTQTKRKSTASRIWVARWKSHPEWKYLLQAEWPIV